MFAVMIQPSTGASQRAVPAVLPSCVLKFAPKVRRPMLVAEAVALTVRLELAGTERVALVERLTVAEAVNEMEALALADAAPPRDRETEAEAERLREALAVDDREAISEALAVALALREAEALALADGAPPRDGEAEADAERLIEGEELGEGGQPTDIARTRLLP